MKRFLVPALIMMTLPSGTASAQVNTQRGSVLGGLAGAAAGVAIGEHNDKPLAGALIGGAVGMATGAVLGNARDKQVAQSRAIQYQQQQQYYQQQQQLQYQTQQMNQQQAARAVSIQDVIAMTQSGLSEAVIMNHIQTNGVRSELQVADVIMLHENGVSQQVISAMQRSRPASVITAAPTPVYQVTPVPVYQSAPPIVVEQYVVPRYTYPAHRPYYGPHYHGHGSVYHYSHRR